MTRRYTLPVLLALLAASIPTAQPLISEYSVRSLNSQNNGFFGQEIAAIGDVDGDGITDFAVGASNEMGNVGRVHLYSGADGAGIRSIVSPTGEADFFGYFVDGAGDLDGDGTPDLLVSDVSAVDGFANAGRVYVVSGASGEIVRTYTSPAPEAAGNFGFNAASPGDLDGDGTPDVVIGTGDEDVTIDGTTYVDRGWIYAFSGDDGSVLWRATTPTPEERTYLGRVVVAGDVTGDGVADLLASAVLADDSEGVESGLAYVFDGTDGSLVYTFESGNAQGNGFFGFTLRGLPDITGDGVPDLAVGAPYEGVGGSTVRDGTVTFFSGSDGASLGTYVREERQAERLHGWEIEPIGDLDGDGVTEIAISAPNQFNDYQYRPPPLSEPFSGAFSVVSGAAIGGEESVLFADVYPSLPDFPTTFRWQYGTDLAPLGDVDGDGLPDLAVGAPRQGADIGFVAVLGGAAIVGISNESVAEEAEVAVPPGAGTYDFGDTGVDLVFGDTRQRVAGGGGATVRVRRYSDGPSSTDGIEEANVSPYRWLVTAEGRFRLTGSGNEIRFRLSETPGAGIEDPASVVVYRRTVAGGTFQPLTTTFDAETGEIVGTGFTDLGEFVLASDAGALPTDDAPERGLTLSVVPNPVRGLGTVSVSVPGGGPVTVEAFDALGRRVAVVWDGPLAAGTHPLRFDASALPAGVYVVRARTAAGTVGRTVTVVR